MSGNFTKVIASDAAFDAEVLRSPVLVLAHFTATWSGPSKALAPIVDKIGQDYQGRAKVVSVDIDNCTETTKKYGVRSVPAVLVFRGGQKVAQSAGLTSRETILKLANL